MRARVLVIRSKDRTLVEERDNEALNGRFRDDSAIQRTIHTSNGSEYVRVTRSLLWLLSRERQAPEVLKYCIDVRVFASDQNAMNIMS